MRRVTTIQKESRSGQGYLSHENCESPPWRTVPIPGHGHQFPDMLLSPSPFGIQVSHRTQRYLLQSLPATPGIRPSASWRTRVLHDGPAGVAVPVARLFQGPATDLVQRLGGPHHDTERVQANRGLRRLLPD